MAARAASQVSPERSWGLAPYALAGSALCWVATLWWAQASGMGAMPGTMGMSVAAFIAMWALMMAAMMLPSVWPFVAVYSRTVVERRAWRLSQLAAGYLLTWTLTGVVAYLVAGLFGWLADGRPTAARLTAVAVFAVAGVYQLSPLKYRCLSHCRTPISHLFHYGGFRGRWRDLRAGASHGFYCLGCCWALMLVMVALGVMNVSAMVGLAVVIALEKMWRHGERLARLVGVAALLWAVAIAASPRLAPGLDPAATMTDMQMPMTGAAGG